jgi:hypothetical protein
MCLLMANTLYVLHVIYCSVKILPGDLLIWKQEICICDILLLSTQPHLENAAGTVD